jgi:hypothetical protein
MNNHHPERVNGKDAGEVVMNGIVASTGAVDEAVATVVRGTSPILSMVPEDRSRVGDVAD